MADQVLKFQPEQKIDSGKPTKKAGTNPRRRLIAGLRRYRRVLPLVVLPIVVSDAGFTLYPTGSRHARTALAYFRCQKGQVTTDITRMIETCAAEEYTFC